MTSSKSSKSSNSSINIIHNNYNHHLQTTIFQTTLYKTPSSNYTIKMSDANNNNSSTLGSYANSTAAAIQSGISSLTGNTADKVSLRTRAASQSTQPPTQTSLTETQVNAEETKAQAHEQNAASKTAAKAGPFAVSGEGGVAKDGEDRTQGRYDQTMGSVKEATGNILGNQGMVQSGRDQNERGQAQEAKGQLKDLKQGVGERVEGRLGGAVAGLTGDREEQERYMDKHVSTESSS